MYDLKFETTIFIFHRLSSALFFLNSRALRSYRVRTVVSRERKEVPRGRLYLLSPRLSSWSLVALVVMFGVAEMKCSVATGRLELDWMVTRNPPGVISFPAKIS